LTKAFHTVSASAASSTVPSIGRGGVGMIKFAGLT
jgi:hypothetical protein